MVRVAKTHPRSSSQYGVKTNQFKNGLVSICILNSSLCPVDPYLKMCGCTNAAFVVPSPSRLVTLTHFPMSGN